MSQNAAESASGGGHNGAIDDEDSNHIGASNSEVSSRNNGASSGDATVELVLGAPELLKQRRRDSDLASWTREQLVERVISLEKHVQQLRNVIAKNSESQLPGVKAEQQEAGAKKFEFSRYKRRHVLLKVCYFGWDYLGFATQEDAGKTIESELFAALLRTRLIESRESANYHRCGRTDRGVSSFSQVISLDVRTNLAEGPSVFAQEGYTGTGQNVKGTEIEYCHILNRNLPDDIKVTAWAPCPTTSFSARFDCEGRTYKYFFPRGGLDLARMEAAGQRLCGEHDYRNFCKMDVNNGVVNYRRRVDRLSVEVLQADHRAHRTNGTVSSEVGGGGSTGSPYDMCVLTIVGKAYLWHQIRCIVSVLFLIGEGREEPEVIDQLLDVEKNPCRPSYGMAADLPLNLFDCDFQNIQWEYDQTALAYVVRTFQKLWTQSAVRTQMMRSCLAELEARTTVPVNSQAESLCQQRRERVYTPLMRLPKCPSLEDKIITVAKRRKIDRDTS